MIKHFPLKVCRIIYYAEGGYTQPVYLIEDGKFFRTVDHEQGWSELPDYELKADGMVYRTHHHILGKSDAPDYRLQKNGLLYQTGNHPNGPTMLPVFKVID